jgi:hypothetical protein
MPTTSKTKAIRPHCSPSALAQHSMISRSLTTLISATYKSRSVTTALTTHHDGNHQLYQPSRKTRPFELLIGMLTFPPQEIKRIELNEPSEWTTIPLTTADNTYVWLFLPQHM